MLMLVTFATVGISQACPDGDNPTALKTPAATQVTAKQQVVVNQSAVTSSIIVFTVRGIACCGSGHCHGYACAGSCCPACSAGVMGAGWTAVQDFTLYFDISSQQISVSSIELDTQYRPPRTIL
jgi:hypothetical protein